MSLVYSLAGKWHQGLTEYWFHRQETRSLITGNFTSVRYCQNQKYTMARISVLCWARSRPWWCIKSLL